MIKSVDFTREAIVMPELHLPDEMWTHIFSYLDYHPLLSVSRVSKNFCAVSSQDDIWRSLCKVHNVAHARNTTNLKNDFVTRKSTQAIESRQVRFFMAWSERARHFSNDLYDLLDRLGTWFISLSIALLYPFPMYSLCIIFAFFALSSINFWAETLHVACKAAPRGTIFHEKRESSGYMASVSFMISAVSCSLLLAILYGMNVLSLTQASFSVMVVNCASAALVVPLCLAGSMWSINGAWRREIGNMGLVVGAMSFCVMIFWVFLGFKLVGAVKSWWFVLPFGWVVIGLMYIFVLYGGLITRRVNAEAAEAAS